MRVVTLFLAIIAAGCATRPPAGQTPAQQRFSAQQEALFTAHADMLKKEGRMPFDIGDSSGALGTYGWHTDCGDSEGPSMPVALLQHCVGGGGAFGAYSFSQAAFDQAQRSWWIHGVMEAGSDILHAVNNGAKFTEQVVGYHVDYIGVAPITRNGKEEWPPALRDLIVVEVPKYSDGSLRSDQLRLNKKAPSFAYTFNIGVLPPDYVNLCACVLK